MPSLDALNLLPASDAVDAFKRCCGSRKWAETLEQARPFKSEENLFSVAKDVWESLTPADWLEAFAHHPRIGEKARPDSNTAGWAQQEQSGTRSATQDTLDKLANGNAEYEKKFGFVFLVCATGKSAIEMLRLLNARLANSIGSELPIAAAEQMKITRIRLEKLLKDG